MPYVTQAALAGQIPPDFLVEALDDDADGVVDSAAWDALAAAVDEEIDATLGQRYTVPFTGTVPDIVGHAAKILALEGLYQRRGAFGDANPWSARAEALRGTLRSIATGEEPLSPSLDRAKSSVSAITEPARTHSAAGHLFG